MPYPALVASHAGIWIADGHGAARNVSRGEAIRAAADTPHLLLNATVTGSRIGYPELVGMDVMELFAFVMPACFAVPTARGLAEALGVPLPDDGAAEAVFLQQAAAMLLGRLDAEAWPYRRGAWDVA